MAVVITTALSPLSHADILDSLFDDVDLKGAPASDSVESFFAEFNENLEESVKDDVDVDAEETFFEQGGDLYDGAGDVDAEEVFDFDVSIEKEPVKVEDVAPARKAMPTFSAIRSGSSDSYFLKNVPTSSKLVFRDGASVLPRESLINYMNGERVYVMPNSEPTAMTFCTVRMSDSGVGRKIAKNRQYTISDVKSKIETYHVEGLGKMSKREVVFDIEHEHVKKVYCMTNQKSSDLNLGDIRQLSGGALDIKLREYLDI
ncbi:hypothetical protein VCHA53O466_40264 [Vibrio chagasii]|nr:hypothetical protein VCHA53O466_40264 [Vibrio chagasii]